VQLDQAIVVDPSQQGTLVLRPVDAPVALPNEAVIRVAAISLNRGEVRRVMMAEAGWRPGWDLAGAVERQAVNDSGPPEGARVVGFLPSGAWATRVAVPTDALAVLPSAVSVAQAATLPVAGLTALYALEQGDGLLGRRVLITGASGGVGHLAIQIARDMGASVVALIRRDTHAAAAHDAGADEVIVGEVSRAEPSGPYDVIIDSVGGQTLGAALGMLARNGVCVTLGTSETEQVHFDARRFYGTGGARLYGFILFHEVRARPASEGLARLAGLVAAGRLRPQIDVEASWTQIADVAQQLIDRRFAGKAVLHIDGADDAARAGEE